MKMKHAHILLFLGLVALVLIAASTATGTKYYTVNNKAQLYTWALDTITNAGNDTLILGEVQSSNWYGILHVDGKQLTGTQGIAVIVQRSGFASPDSDQWGEDTRDTLNGTSEQLFIDLGRLEAFSYRVIIDGYGTQSTEYEAVLNLKKD